MPRKKAAKKTTKKVTRSTTTTTTNPPHDDDDFELDVIDRGEDLAAENRRLRRTIAQQQAELCRLAGDAHASSARHARVSRAAAHAGMDVPQWIAYCRARTSNPESFDRSIREALDSDRAREPHRARRLSGGD